MLVAIIVTGACVVGVSLEDLDLSPYQAKQVAASIEKELNLSPRQTKQVIAILEKHARVVRELVKKGGDTPKTTERLKAIEAKRDEDIERALEEEQVKKFRAIRKLQREGVPIGGGLFRSYTIRPYERPSEGRSRVLSLGGAADRIQSAALDDDRPDGIEFEVNNKSGMDYASARLAIEFLDQKGTRVGDDYAVLENLANGKTVTVRVLGYQDHSRVEVKLIPSTVAKP